MTIVFSSDRFPQDVAESARLRRWQEFVEEQYGGFSMSFAADRPFFAQAELVRAGSVLVDHFRATLTRGARGPRQIAADGNDDFFIAVNCGPGSMMQRQLGGEIEHAPGSLLLLSNSEPGEVTSAAGVDWLSVYVPRRVLLERVRRAEDLIARPIDVSPQIAAYLASYLRHVITAGAAELDPVVAKHVGATLIDLVATALEAGRDSAWLHRPGVRGAQLRQALTLIETRYDDPGFSPRQLAAKLGVTQRYVQDLLHETGSTFSDRVMELRLQKARAMLGDPRRGKLKISDIAYACGFNEVPYFNRCFRQRFAATPTQFRFGTGGA